MYMANSNSGSEQYRPAGHMQLVCRCNLPVKQLTSNTKDNPFRRFFKCRDNRCDTWEWIDDELPMRVKRGITKCMDQIEGLKKELHTVKDEVEKTRARLQAKDTTIFLLKLVIIILVAMIVLK
ncbi:hypothetical protein Dimus_002524 [Dionaea muscipula]